jgi:osmotically-inducible protein OsmY
VYLQGRVTQAEAARATELARSVGGVRQVVKVFEYLTDEQFKNIVK